MAFLRLNGWKIPVLNGTAGEQFSSFSEDDQSNFSGRPTRSRAAILRSLSMQAKHMTPDDADTLAGLLQGQGHHFGFSMDAFSDSGIGPSSTSSYGILPCTFGLVPRGMHGTHYCLADSLGYDLGMPLEAWTVSYFRDVNTYDLPGISSPLIPIHITIRSDGAKWVNGTRNDSFATPEFSFEDGGIIFDKLDNYISDLVCLPFKACESFIVSSYRWTGTLDSELLLGSPSRNADTAPRWKDAPDVVLGSNAQAGPFGYAFDFSASSSSRLAWSGTQKAGAFLAGQSECTLEAWICHTTTGSGTIARRYTTTPQGWILYVDHTPADGFRVGLDVRTTGAVGLCRARSSYGVAPIGSWTHVAATWQKATGECRIYIDGRDATAEQTMAPGESTFDDRALAFALGNNPGGGGPNLKGQMAGFRKWTVALSQEEIDERYRAGAGHGRVHPAGGPFSRLPVLSACGDVTGWQDLEVLGIVEQEPIIPAALPAWKNNARTIFCTLSERAPKETEFDLSPIAAWHFGADEISASTFYDDAKIVPATPFGAPFLTTEGPYGHGRAMNCRALGDYFDMNDAKATSLLHGRSKVTALAWVRIPSSNVSNNCILSTYTSTTQAKFWFGVSGSSGVNKVRVIVRPSGSSPAITFLGDVQINDDNWHLIGASVDLPSERVCVFIDSAGFDPSNPGEYKETTASFTAETFDGSSTAGYQRLLRTGGSTEYFSGDIPFFGLFQGYFSAQDTNRVWRSGVDGLLLKRIP